MATFVNQVAGPSADDTWAVGWRWESGDVRAVARHFDGQSWHTLYRAPDLGTTLVSIAWFSDKDVWVGGYGLSDHRIVMHWDGRRWHRMRMRGPGTVTWVGMLTGTGDDDLWALSFNGTEYLLEHWDGSRWRSYPYPYQDEGHGVGLAGLSAAYPTSIWAAGQKPFGGGLLLYWNGHKWINRAEK